MIRYNGVTLLAGYIASFRFLVMRGGKMYWKKSVT